MTKPTRTTRTDASVFSTKFATIFWDRVDKTAGCWLWAGTRSRGYGVLMVDKRQWRAHRVAWTLAFGPIPAGHGVLHHCDNPPCVRPSHLFTGIQADNMRDAQAKGRLNGRPGLPKSLSPWRRCAICPPEKWLCQHARL